MNESTNLSERELEILRLVATGASNKEIARKLVISLNTVKVHVRNIFAKIGVLSRTEATIYAIQTGVVPQPGGTVTGEANTQSQTTDTQLFIKTTDEIQQYISHSEPDQRTDRKRLTFQRFILVFFVLVVAVLAAGYLIPLPGLSLLAGRGSTTNIEPLPRWQTRTPMPVGKAKVALATYENAIYAIGGEIAQGSTGDTYRYLPEEDVWQKLAPKPHPVSDASAVLLGELIYVPGGRLENGQLTSEVEVFDPRQNTWEEHAPLPTPRSGYALVSFEGRLYLFGGWDGSKAVNTVFEYIPDEDTWRERTPMPTARMFCAATVAGGKIFVIGGTNGPQNFNVNEVYYPQRDMGGESPWETQQPMPDALGEVTATSIANTVFVVGETLEGTLGLYDYLPQKNQWEKIQPGPQESLNQPGMIAFDTFLYFIGGKKDRQYSKDTFAYEAVYRIILPQASK
jgi:DNA-binding CsgD family transcriptional regulator